MTPKRIKLSRAKGWRKPEGAIVVSRPTIFGNPFRAVKSECCANWDAVDDNGVNYLIDHTRAHKLNYVNNRDEAARKCVQLFADELTYWVGGRMSWDPDYAAAVSALRGRDLACWCPLDQPCHADVLLKIANGGAA